MHTSVTTHTPLADRVAIVTGASRGIGAATSRALSRAGASVVLAARNEQALSALAEEITASGGQALAVPTDVTRYGASSSRPSPRSAGSTSRSTTPPVVATHRLRWPRSPSPTTTVRCPSVSAASSSR